MAAVAVLPELSAILVTPDDARTLAKSLRCLAGQTARERIEVVIGAPEPAEVAIDEDTRAAFFDLRVVRADVSTSARARAAAIRAARAPIIALAEDHCFPEPDWAERIIAAHRGPYAVVGPVMANANPRTATSWANLAVEYGLWLRADRPREVDHLPGHNSAYKREVLAAYDNRLAEMLEAESVLHWDLRARGHRLLLDPALRLHHLNFSLPRPAVLLQFRAGRMFAASRAAGWPAARRLLYALASPAIPAVRLGRVLRHLAALPRGGRLALRTAPMAAVLLTASGVGEFLGYLLGDGGVRPALAAMEFHRARNLVPAERRLAFE